MIIFEILRHNLSDNILNYMFVFLISIRGTKSFIVNFVFFSPVGGIVRRGEAKLTFRGIRKVFSGGY